MLLFNKLLEYEQQLRFAHRDHGRDLYLEALISAERLLDSTTGRVHDQLQVYLDRDLISLAHRLTTLSSKSFLRTSPPSWMTPWPQE